MVRRVIPAKDKNDIILDIRLFIFGILLIQPLGAYSQGLTFIENFDSDIYGAHRQNWAIVQDDLGYILFGNQSGGTVKFDGYNWEAIHVPTGNTVRSLHQSANKTFWGGNGDFGYMEGDSLNNFSVVSLKSQVDSTYHDFSDIWRIIESDSVSYFQPYKGIYKTKDEKVEVFRADQRILGLFKLNQNVMIKIENEGLAFLAGDSLSYIKNSELYGNDPLYVVLPLNNEHLFISREQGFMLFDGRQFRSFETEVAEYIEEHLVYRGTYINDKQIALATLTGGIVIINTDGSLHSILTEEDGLPTNIIYELYVDREETLWAATDNGIAKMLVNNPVTKLDERSGFGGIPTFIESTGSTTYFGSTEGLFYSEEPGRLTKAAKINNRIYDGISFGNEILAAAPEGLYRITENDIRLLSSSGFRLLESSDSNPNLFFGASYDSVYALKREGNQIEETALVAAPGHVQNLYFYHDELWVTTAETGVFRYNLDGLLIKKYEIPLSEDQAAHRLDVLSGRLLLGTSAGLFVHSPSSDSFVVDTTFQHREMTTNQVNLFRQCADNEIWFRNNRKIKRADYDSGRWNIIEDPYRLIDEGESITTIHCGEDNSVWFGGTAGIYHLADPDWEYNHEFNTNVTGLLVRNDSLIYGGYGEPDRTLELAYTDNDLRFNYASASYIAPEGNTYRTRLRGYEDDWSSWTSETEKDYTFIPDGTYTFEVQGRNIYHKAGTIDSFTFTILPPWYRTWWAYTFYALLLGGLIYGGHKFRINRFLREQRIRNRIASDLHDEVSATLSSITYFAQAIRQMQSEKQTDRFVGLISESAYEAKEKITDIIWSIDPDNDDWVNLLSKCRRFASDLLESKNMEYELNMDTDIAHPLDVELRQHLWLIFKEMVVNTARHSGAKRVDIFFGLQDGTLKLVVQDNGTGIEDNVQTSGNGIKNIHKRAQELGADLELETDLDIGTRWIMTIEM